MSENVDTPVDKHLFKVNNKHTNSMPTNVVLVFSLLISNKYLQTGMTPVIFQSAICSL